MCALRRSFLALCAILLLASCGRHEGLPSQEVLSKAARATRDVQSANFSLQAAMESTPAAGGGLSGTLQATGRMQHAGEQLAFTVHANGQSGQTGVAGGFTWVVDGDVTVAAENEVYIILHELTTDPPDALVPSIALQSFLNQWWHLPPRAGAEPTVTPNPELLKMQAEVVDVTRDRGLEGLDGNMSYHYDVTLNQEKLLAFLEKVAQERGEPFDPSSAKSLTETMETAGELWIDAQTFFVQGIQWTITSKDSSRPFRLQFQLKFADFNNAEPIEPPQGSELLPTPSLDSVFPAPFPLP